MPPAKPSMRRVRLQPGCATPGVPTANDAPEHSRCCFSSPHRLIFAVPLADADAGFPGPALGNDKLDAAPFQRHLLLPACPLVAARLVIFALQIFFRPKQEGDRIRVLFDLAAVAKD